MKLAFMTSLAPDWSLDQTIEAMHRHGYTGLEPRIGWQNACGFDVSLKPAERDALRERFAAEDKAICCIATGCRFATEDTQELEGHIKDAIDAIDLAADLGAPFIRTFGGAHGGGEMTPVAHRTAEAYKRVVDHAAKRGVIITFETHDVWCSTSLVREVVNLVNHPNLRVLWDVMHPQRVFERPEESMGIIGNLTAHVHVHDGSFVPPKRALAITALGEGVIDHETPLRLLSEAGYDGYVSVEVIHKPGSEHDPEPVLKQYAEGLRAILDRISKA